MDLLARILESKRQDVAALPPSPPSAPASLRAPPIDVLHALRRPAGEPLRLIAEVKFKSPSAGPLSRALGPADRAMAYAEAGASMVSILCDGPFFDGSWDHVAQARRALADQGRSTAILAKEFVLDERQILEAARRGANAVLLIARIVSAERLGQLVAFALAEGIEPLVEVVDEAELSAALAGGGRVVGVNARDLDTLAIDPDRTARVLGAIPPSVVAVYLSGVRTPNDVIRVAKSRADAALIGEALMRDDDPRPRLRAMVDAAKGADPT